MKKILVFLLTVILAVSCDCNCHPEYLDAKDGVWMGKEDYYLPGPEGEEKTFHLKLERFMFRGHDYIIFYHGYDYLHGTQFEDDSWIHDPDCRKCSGNHSATPLSSYSSMFEW